MMAHFDDFDFEEGAIHFEDYNDCVLGKDYDEGRVVYSIEMILEKMMTTQDWSMEDSIEFFDANVAGVKGDLCPRFVWQGDSYHGY